MHINNPHTVDGRQHMRTNAMRLILDGFNMYQFIWHNATADLSDKCIYARSGIQINSNNIWISALAWLKQRRPSPRRCLLELSDAFVDNLSKSCIIISLPGV